MQSEPQTLTVAGLHGSQLGAVVFVQDYLQLQLDGNTVTLTVWPVVCRDREFRFGELQYRDALCECISKVVRNAQIVDREYFRIVFEDGCALITSLKDADRVDPETVRVDLKDGHWSVW